MKQHMAIITMLATIAIFLHAEGVFAGAETNSPASPPGWFRRTFCRLTFSEIITTITSPKEACAAVRHNVTFKEDLDDEWATAETTWNRESGDCEDFAACVVELCKRAGFDAWVEIFYPRDGIVAHAVALGFDKDGNMWMSSNGWFEKVKSVADAKETIAHELRWKNMEILNSAPEDFLKDVSAAAPGDRKWLEITENVISQKAGRN